MLMGWVWTRAGHQGAALGTSYQGQARGGEKPLGGRPSREGEGVRGWRLCQAGVGLSKALAGKAIWEARKH